MSGRLLLAALALLLLGACDRGQDVPPPLEGRPFPAFRLARLEGGEATEADVRGRPLLVNFWATWCEPCRREMASLQRLAERLAPAGLEVMGVTVDSDLHLAREFVLQNGIRFAQLADPERKLSRALGLQAYPHTLLLAPDGRILWSVVGSREWDEPALVEEVRRRALIVEPRNRS